MLRETYLHSESYHSNLYRIAIEKLTFFMRFFKNMEYSIAGSKVIEHYLTNYQCTSETATLFIGRHANEEVHLRIDI